MFRDEFVVKKRVFDKRSAHSKAVLDDSLITVDTTAHHLIKWLAKKSHESHNSKIALSTVIFQFCGYFPTNDVVLAFPTYILCLACKYLIFSTISELVAIKRPNNSPHLPQLIRDSRKILKIANQVMTVACGQINSQSKHDLNCYKAKVKATKSLSCSDSKSCNVINQRYL